MRQLIDAGLMDGSAASVSGHNMVTRDHFAGRPFDLVPLTQ